MKARMTKCTNPKHNHLHINGQTNIPCERKEQGEAGVTSCNANIVPTNGQIFRDLYGFSPTMKKLMQKAGLDWKLSESLSTYRKLRKPLRDKALEIKKAKHDSAKAGRNSKSKSIKK